MRFLFVLLAGCSVHFALNGDEQVACTTDADCFGDGQICSARGLCINQLVNVAPSLSANLAVMAQRSSSTVDVSIVVADANGPPDGDDSATVSARYRVGMDGEWHAATTTLTTTALTWNAAADLGGTQVDTDGDEQPDTQMAVSQADLYLEIAAIDQGGLSAAPVVLGPFAVGNTPPAVTTQADTGEISGVVVFALQVEDADGDLLDAQVQFRDPADGQWRNAEITAGETESILPRTDPYLIAWNSRGLTHVDPLTPQGLGARNVAAVDLRVRGVDALGVYGAWQQLRARTVHNQHPTRIGQLAFINRPEGNVIGALGLAYTLTDEESEPAAITAEYSTDSGAHWQTCTELVVPQSEGTAMLATRTEGIAHVFAWDTTSDVVAAQPTQVRLGSEAGTAIIDAGAVGFDFALGSDRAPLQWEFLFGPQATPGTVLQVKANSITNNQLLMLDQLGHYVFLDVRNLSLAPPDGVVIDTHNASGAVAVAAARLNGDALDDAIIAFSDRVEVHYADPAAPSGPYAATGTAFAATGLTVDAVGAGDVDGDSTIDIIVSGTSMLQVFGGATFPLSAGYKLLGVGDIDGDGKADLFSGGVDLPLEVRGTGAPRLLAFSLEGAVTIADVDADGDADILGSRGNLVVIGDNTAGTFTEKIVATMPLAVRRVSWVDGDNDGARDIWVETATGGSLFHSGRSSASFATPASTRCINASFPVGSTIFVAESNYACDFVVNGAIPPRFWYDRFYTPQAIANAWSAHLVTTLASRVRGLADVDHDGTLDRLSVDAGVLYVQHNNSSNGFAAGLYAPGTERSLANAAHALFGDFDGDGTLDVLGWSAGPSGTRGTLVIGEQALPLWSGESALFNVLAAGDLDGDGDDDLATSLGTMLSNGQSFAAVVAYPEDFVAVAAAIGDVDRDGTADIVITRHYSGDPEPGNPGGGSPGNVVQVIDGSTRTRMCPIGTATCTPPLCATYVNSFTQQDEVQIADLDNDGLLDVMTTGQRFNDVTLSYARGKTGECSPFSGNTSGFDVGQVSSTHDSQTMTIADINGDGFADVMRGDAEWPAKVLYGASGGTLAAPVSLALPESTPPLAADTNSDGRIDLSATFGGGLAAFVATAEPLDPLLPLTESAHLYRSPYVPSRIYSGNTPDFFSLVPHSVLDRRTAIPLSRAWHVDGDRRETTIVDAAGRLRVRIEPRASGDFIFSFPARAGVSDPIALIVRDNPWQRATDDTTLLPLGQDGRSLRKPAYAWRLIPQDDDGDIHTGSNEACVHAGNTVFVRLHALGDMQAVSLPF